MLTSSSVRTPARPSERSRCLTKKKPGFGKDFLLALHLRPCYCFFQLIAERFRLMVEMSPAPKAQRSSLLCPSALPEVENSFVFAIIDNRSAERRVHYLGTPMRATAEIVDLAGGELPTDVFRFTAPCREKECSHFVSGGCRLPDLIVNMFPVSEELPACSIRGACRWFAQAGGTACLRCPHIVTSEVEAPAGF